MKPMLNLIDAMQIKYGTAKRLQRGALICALLVLGAGVLAGIPALSAGAGWIAAAVFGLQILAFLLTQAAADFAGEGEEMRRMAMLKDGLGVEPSQCRVAQVLLSIYGKKNSEPAYIGPYYDSEFAVGPRRLIDITTECAFFTSGNTKYFSNFIGLVVVAGALMTVVAFVGFVSSSDDVKSIHDVSKVFIASMVFWVTGEAVGMYRTLRGVAGACDKILESGERQLAQPADAERDGSTATALFADYNAAVVKSPLIPGWIYWLRRDSMNTAWLARKHPATTHEVHAANREN